MFNPTIEVIVAQPRVLNPPDLSLEGILRRCPGLVEAEAVCQTGSTAAGWGNAFSDIDLYAFSDQEIDLPADEATETWPGSDPSGLRWRNWMGVYDNARVDLKVWPTNALDMVLKPYLETEPEFCQSTFISQDLAYRISIGIPLKNESFFRRMRALIDRSSYRRALARTAKARAENRFMDVAGQLLSGDQITARLVAMQAAAEVADACLVVAGEICRGDKWLLRRLESAPNCGIGIDEYRSIVLGGLRPGESDGDCALRIARWAQAHMIRIENVLFAASQPNAGARI